LVETAKLVERPKLIERVGPIEAAGPTAPHQTPALWPGEGPVPLRGPCEAGPGDGPWRRHKCLVGRVTCGSAKPWEKEPVSQKWVFLESQQLPQAACRQLTLAPAERGRESRKNVISPSNVSSLYSNSCGLPEYLVEGTVVVIHWEINRFSPAVGAFHL
jgi:hypothetical protein